MTPEQFDITIFMCLFNIVMSFTSFVAGALFAGALKTIKEQNEENNKIQKD